MDFVWEHVDPKAITTKVISFIPNILSAVIVLIAFFIGAIIVRKLLTSALRKGRVPSDAQNLLLRFVRYTTVIVALLMVADQLGINISALLAGVGIVGLAISFAAQDTIQNIISGIAIIVDRPFRQGDWICVGDQNATVTDIRLRTTVLTTFDNEAMVVPNKTLAQERIINYTLTPKIRVRVSLGIAYKEKIAQARDVLLKTIEGDNLILSDPEPIVIATGLGASSVNLELRFWVEDPQMKLPMEWEYTEKCKTALDRAGIQIPFPHMQLFLEKTEGVMALADGRRDPGDSSEKQG